MGKTLKVLLPQSLVSSFMSIYLGFGATPSSAGSTGFSFGKPATSGGLFNSTATSTSGGGLFGNTATSTSGGFGSFGFGANTSKVSSNCHRWYAVNFSVNLSYLLSQSL